MKSHKLLSVFLGLSLFLGDSVVTPAEEITPDAKARLIDGSSEMTDGVIRKIDIENGKITIKHGEIRNLEMPGMTMVFQVKEPALLDKVKTGDKVKFKAEKAGSALVVTDILPVK